MIQIDMEMPKFCWWMDGNDYHKCPMVDDKNGCCLHSNVSYATWEEQHKHCPLHEVTDTDTISREAVIDAIFSEPLYKTGMKKRDADAVVPAIYEKIKSLPSAQPEKRTEERTETHGVCLDAIDRQAVIDTVRKIILGFFSDEDGVMNDTEKTLLSVNKAVCNGVRELPSAQPEPYREEGE